MTRLLSEHLERFNSTEDADLQVEVSRFLYLIFNHKTTRPAALQLRRLERPSTERFLEHQASILEEVKLLARELLLLYPHRPSERRGVCQNLECRKHMEELQTILRAPSASDLELEGSRVVGWTPATRAIECLRYCARVHSAASVGDRASFLWLRHKSACWERAERLRISPGRSMDVLLSWVVSREAGVPTEEVRHHLNRVTAEMLSISSSFGVIRRLVDRFRYSCELDADRLREAETESGARHDGESITSLAVGYLADFDVPAWSVFGRRRAAVGKWSLLRPVAITTVPYGREDAHSTILEGVCKAHARLSEVGEPLSETLVILLRLDGPVCEVPDRLEFDRFAMSLTCVDIADASLATTERIFLHTDEILNAICQYELTEGPPTERNGCLPPPLRSELRPAARHRSAMRSSRTNNGLVFPIGARRDATGP